MEIVITGIVIIAFIVCEGILTRKHINNQFIVLLDELTGFDLLNCTNPTCKRRKTPTQHLKDRLDTIGLNVYERRYGKQEPEPEEEVARATPSIICPECDAIVKPSSPNLSTMDGVFCNAGCHGKFYENINDKLNP